MKKLKKLIMYIAGPGVIMVEIVAIFIHLFTTGNAKPWIIAGLVVFFVVFIPLYSVEYFRQNFKDEKDKRLVQFRKGKTRTEWEGGNIHGKTPTKIDRPGRMFNR